MKASVPVNTIGSDALSGRGRFSVWAELFKARLTSLVLITTTVGYYLGSRGGFDVVGALVTLLGTGALAAGAAALNQLIERDYDARMRRTQDRPLPAGKLRPETVAWVGVAASAAGLAVLALGAGYSTAVLGGITLVTYLFVYTPLKRVTPLNTVVGAIPGALPPLMGWTAARGQIEVGGWALFAILAFWQLPHFLAIAWMYRDDYARGGFAMLPVFDADGRRTSATALAHTLGLMAVSLSPFQLGLVGPIYLGGALVLGLGFFGCAWAFAHRVSHASARRLFYASILYLPLLLVLMVIDKI